MWLTFIITFFLRINQEIFSHIPPANPADLITLTNYTSGKTQHAFPSQSQEIFLKYDIEHFLQQTANQTTYAYLCAYMYVFAGENTWCYNIIHALKRTLRYREKSCLCFKVREEESRSRKCERHSGSSRRSLWADAGTGSPTLAFGDAVPCWDCSHCLQKHHCLLHPGMAMHPTEHHLPLCRISSFLCRYFTQKCWN